MLAGFAEKEFTPEKGNMPGEIGPYFASGTRTPLMAHAAVITSGEKTAVFVSMDIIFITTALSDRIKKKISDAIAVPVENILLACTHTHTGCGTDYQCWGTPAEPEVAEFAGEMAVAAAVEAFENRTACKYGTGVGYEPRFSFNRDWYMADGRLRSNPGFRGDDLVMPFDTVDQSVHVMRIDSVEEDRPLCFIVNYANHPDNHKKRDKFSADYPGYLRLALRRRFGRDVTVVFLNGTCGDVNDMDFKYNTSESYRAHGLCPPELIGEGLAETVAKINESIVTKADEPFMQASSEMQTTLRRHATAEMRAWAKMIMDKKAAGEEKMLEHSVLLAEQYLAEPEEMPATCEVEVHVMQLGDWVIVGLPGEIYTCIGTRIKANSPFPKTLVVELESGANGYISPDVIQDCGAYEGIYSTIAFTGHGTVDVLVNGATKMLNAMHKEYLDKAIGGLVNRPVYISRKN